MTQTSRRNRVRPAPPSQQHSDALVRLESWAAARNSTVPDVLRAHGLSPDLVGQARRYGWRTDIAERIAQAFDRTPAELLGWATPPPPPPVTTREPLDLELLTTVIVAAGQMVGVEPEISERIARLSRVFYDRLSHLNGNITQQDVIHFAVHVVRQHLCQKAQPPTASP